MSKTVDERVVSMQFDNRNFERNVSTTMSTLDKLKQKLNLSGAAKGLDNVNTAAKNVDMNGLGKGVETVRAKFSALQVMGVTALANIANSAVNAGKRIVRSLTLDPIKDGFDEYEMTLNAVQTTMAGTGKTAKEVEVELKKLDEYADKTVYSTADMLNNLPKFTNAGVELETATKAMIGIANATAHAGGDASKASIAFYNLGQAIGTGYLTRMDYNSINNAGIATMEWKNQMVEAAIAQGTLTKVGEDAYKAGNKTFTLQQLFIDGLQEQWATTDVMIDVFGDYGDETTEIGKKAYESATKIKTFTMMMDSLKATAGTGWKDTWQLIFGGLDEAAEFWTGLYEFISGIVEKMADFRNDFIGGVLGNPFEKIAEKLKGLTGVTEGITNVTGALSKVTKNYNAIVDEIIAGKWGNNQKRWDALTEAGYDWAHAQNLVNEKLGSSVRHTTNYKEAQDELNESQKKTQKSQAKTIEQLVKMSDAELETLGLTKEEIKAFRELEEQSKKTGIPIEELIKDIDQLSGRSLLINAFKNAWSGVKQVFEEIKGAWQDVFPPKSSEERIEIVYNLIAALHKFSTKLKMSDETADKLRRTFRGLFSLIEIITSFFGGAFKIAFKVLQSVLSYFNMDILDLTAIIGDALVKFRDWIDRTVDLSAVLDVVVPWIQKAAKAVKDWFSAIKEGEDAGADTVQGLIEGLKAGVKKVWNAAVEIAKAVIESVKKVLGIHSPSIVFIAIGAMIISGLIKGLQEGGDSVGEVLKNIGLNIVEKFKNIDIGSLFVGIISAGFVTGILKLLNNVSNLLGGLGDMFGGVGEVLSESAKPIKKILKNTAKVVKSFAKVMNSLSFNIRMKGIKDLAISIGILVGSILLLAYMIDSSETGGKSIMKAVGVIGILALILIGLAVATDKLSQASVKLDKSGLSGSGFKNSLMGIAGALLIVAGSVMMLGMMKPEQLEQGIKGMTAVLLSLVIMLVAYTALNTKFKIGDIDKAGNMLIKVAGAMLILAIVAKMLSGMSWPEMGKAGAGLAGLIAAVALLVLITKMAGSDLIGDVGDTLFKMAAAIAVLAIVAKMIAKMEWSEMGKAGAGLGGLVLIVAGLILATKLAGNDIDKVGGTIFKIGAAMAILAITAKIIAGMEWSEMGKAAVGLIALGGIITGLVTATKLAGGGKKLTKIGATILLLSLSIAILAGVAALLGFLSIEHLAKGVIAVGILAAIMAGLIQATKNAKNCHKTIVAMAAAIGVMATALVVLSFIEPDKLGSATIALGVVMGMFALIVKAGSNMNSSVGTLIVMTAAIGVMAGMIYLLAGLPVESTIGAAASLSLLMLAMSGVLFIVSKVGKSGKGALIGVGLLLAMAVPLIAFVGVLAVMQNVQNAMNNVLALIVLATALTLLLIPLTLIGALWMPALIGVGILTTMAVPLIAFVGVLAVMENIPNATANADLLTGVMTKIAAVLIAVAMVSPLALIAVTALTMMTGLMVTLGLLVTAMGALNKDGKLEELVNNGIPILEKLAYAIGSMIGNLVAAFANAVMDTLPPLGEKLSAFMDNAKGFIDGARTIDSSVLEGIGILSAAIIALTLADLIAGISSFLQLGSSMADLGTELSQFMINATPFITGAMMIKPEMLEGVRALAETVLILTAANIIDGIASFFSGESSLASFGAQLGELGANLNTFATNLGTFDESKVTTITCAANAIKAIAEASKTLPNEGGWLAKIVGDNSIGTFGSYLPSLGTQLSAFATNLGTFSEEQVATVTCAANAIKAISEAAEGIPNEGGWLAKIVGDNSIKTFGGYLPGLGTNLSDFATNLGEFSDAQVTTVTCAANAIKAMAEAAEGIPNEGGWFAKIVGDNSIATFGSYLPDLGTNLAGFATNLGEFTDTQVATVGCAANAIKVMSEAAEGIDGQADWAKKIFGDNSLSAFGEEISNMGTSLNSFATNLGTFGEDKVATVKSAVDAIKAFSGLADADLKGAKQHLGGFGEETVDFAEDISSFVTNLPSSESITGAVSKVNSILGMIDSIASANSDAVSGFVDALKELGSNAVDEFVKAFTSSTAKTDVKKAAEDLVAQAVKGVEEKQSSLEKAFKNAAGDSADAIKDKKSSFKSAGKELVNGFAAGIDERTWYAEARAKAMADAAEKAAKEELDINSPSKVFRALGYSVPEGFAIGIDRMGGLVKTSATDMAKTAINNVKRSISKIADAINTDIDSQPTIRPVLDLSDVRSGASTIGGLFDTNPSVGVLANVGAISSMMNRNGQNGGNAEVVSAIDKLRKDLGNVGNTTYNVNGVTYDDGSNVKGAVEQIVRAARIGRRV